MEEISHNTQIQERFGNLTGHFSSEDTKHGFFQNLSEENCLSVTTYCCLTFVDPDASITLTNIINLKINKNKLSNEYYEEIAKYLDNRIKELFTSQIGNAMNSFILRPVIVSELRDAVMNLRYT